MRTPRLLAEHFFRHEYGRLVATLTRRVGEQHIETVEDAVQSAMMSALESWTVAGLPDNPTAWLFRAAQNRLWSELRQQVRHRRLAEQHDAETVANKHTLSDPRLADEMDDDLLRMLFVCCDEALPRQSQLVLALKVLCGFEVREIALRLLMSEENVYKRLGRARTRLRALPRPTDTLSGEQFRSRLRSVRTVLYLMFTEGHLSSSREESAIRRELCAEAIRLTEILANHPIGVSAETSALLALMHLHSARLAARVDEAGGLLLLEEQQRDKWNPDEIACGLAWLAKSATGDVFSRFHAEAGIAAEHCLAASFGETNWQRVVEYYEILESIAPSAIHRLNRAIAVAELHGPAAGLAVLDNLTPSTWPAGSYMMAAVLADLHGRCGDVASASHYRDLACQLAPNAAVRVALQRRLHVNPLGDSRSRERTASNPDRGFSAAALSSLPSPS